MRVNKPSLSLPGGGACSEDLEWDPGDRSGRVATAEDSLLAVNIL